MEKNHIFHFKTMKVYDIYIQNSSSQGDKNALK